MRGRLKHQREVSNKLSSSDRFLIEPWLTKNELHIITGRPGAGKTTLLLQAISAHLEQLSPVVYVGGDRSLENYLSLMKRLEIDPGLFPIFSWVSEVAFTGYDNVRRRIYNAQVENLAWLTKIAEDIHPKLLIVDPAQTFIPCRNMNDQTESAAGFQHMMQFCLHYDTTLLLVWHSNKRLSKDVGDVFDRLSGSTAIQGYTSTKAVLCAPSPSGEGDHPDAPCVIIRGQNFADTTILLEWNDGRFAVRQESDDTFDVLSLVGEAPTKVRDILSQSALSRRSVYRALGALESQGSVRKAGRGMWARTSQ